LWVKVSVGWHLESGQAYLVLVRFYMLLQAPGVGHHRGAIKNRKMDRTVTTKAIPVQFAEAVGPDGCQVVPPLSAKPRATGGKCSFDWA